jgi:hypothetical protein
MAEPAALAGAPAAPPAPGAPPLNVPAAPANPTTPAASGAVPLAHAAVLHWLLRLACVFEFVGHGAFGVITKAAWVPYYGVAGIPPEWAYKLMPLTGGVDIFLGFLVLLRPVRAALLYMTLWGLWTALLRPLSGEPVWETVERAPNYLVPAAFLAVRGLPAAWRGWLR